MDVMYRVKPICGDEEIVLPSNMYFVKPIADADSSDFIRASCKSSGDHPVGKPSPGRQSNPTAGKPAGKGKENQVSNEKLTGDKTTTAKETKDQKHGKKPRKKGNSGSEKGKDSGQSKGDGQSSSSKDDQGSKKDDSPGDKKDEGEEGRGFIPTVCEAPFVGNLIGTVIVHDIAIQADFDYTPLRVLKVINHLRKNFGLKIAVKVHISSTVLDDSEINVDEWKMFETFESTILPRQDNQLVVSLIVKRFTVKEAWLNKQPYMILDPHLGTAIYGEVNIARHITRLSSQFCPLCAEIYPEVDPSQSEAIKDIDETLNEIQKFLFVRNLQDKSARPSIPEIKDKRLKDNSGLDLKLTLDYILLLSLKL